MATGLGEAVVDRNAARKGPRRCAGKWIVTCMAAIGEKDDPPRRIWLDESKRRVERRVDIGAVVFGGGRKGRKRDGLRRLLNLGGRREGDDTQFLVALHAGGGGGNQLSLRGKFGGSNGGATVGDDDQRPVAPRHLRRRTREGEKQKRVCCGAQRAAAYGLTV